MADNPAALQGLLTRHLDLLRELAETGGQLKLITGIPPAASPLPAPSSPWIRVEDCPGPQGEGLHWTWDGQVVGLGMYDGAWISVWTREFRQRGAVILAWAYVKAPEPPQ